MALMTSQQAKCLLYAVGIFVCYFYYGILQETITKGKYLGADGKEEKFNYTITLVFIQCVINATFALLAKKMFDNEDVDKTSSILYALCSISYLGAMLASNLALQWVAYPTQVLGKSAKPIPVMIMGVIFARKRYPLLKYMFVLCITIGVALFVYKDSKSKGLDADKPVGLGELLLLVSLTLDGATGATQSRMRSDYKTSAGSMMLNMNLWSILWLVIALCTGEALVFTQFAQRNPQVLWDMVKFGLASALGQHFIFLVVANFGPLTCSIVTTTRKFFTILASVLWFGNDMSSRQWTGTALVFLGLSLDMLYGKESKPVTDTDQLKKSAKTKGVEHSQ